jgi:hypothetical protein
MGLLARLHLSVQLPPLLLRPAKLFDGRGEVEEVHGHYRGAGTQIGVADEGIELPTSLDQTLMDLLQAFPSLGRVVRLVFPVQDVALLRI